MPPRQSRFRILLADLHGDEPSLAQTRHVEAALKDQPGIGLLPVGEGPDLADGEIDDQTLEQSRSILAAHNGDSLILGHVMPAGPRIRLRMIGRYEEGVGCHGPYQIDWAELPKRFGLDFEGQLLTLAALSMSPSARDDEGRACLVELLRPAATKLTRLLEQQAIQTDSEQQGRLWHALGLATSMLGEFTKSQRWLDVAVHAHKTALLIWRDDKVVFDWAIAQNNLGYALKLLAVHTEDEEYQAAILKQSAEAFRQALYVYRSGRSHYFASQTKTNLARVEAVLANRPIAAE